MPETTKTISQGNLRVELDLDKWYPDDPAADFPTMVYLDSCGKTYSATYAFAAEEEYLQGNETPSDPDYDPITDGASKYDWLLTRSQLRWLWNLESEIDAFLAIKGVAE